MRELVPHYLQESTKVCYHNMQASVLYICLHAKLVMMVQIRMNV